MRKLIVLLFSLIFMSNVNVFASGIEIEPTMQSKTSAQDRVWVGTFQLVWNDFIDKVVHNPIRFREGTPATVQELNKQEFTTADLSEKSYYKTTCRVTKKTKREIAKAIKKKFKESSDLLDSLDLTPRNDMFLIYAMLKKDFEFANAFDKLGTSDFGNGQKAEYFGINYKSNDKLDDGVYVLFYNSKDDFAVKLATKDNDEVYLYKNSANKPFNYIYSDMNKKEQGFKGNAMFKKNDELKVPNIKFFEEKSFDELTGKRVMGTNIVINQALETIKFNMNHKGVELKSEASMTFTKLSLDPPEEAPRYFYFDDTFVVFLKEKGKNNPYFALRVNDITKFQK